jgi:hypothetical protein
MSLGSILATAAPIAVGAMVPGGGWAAIMAGAATGAGIAALSGGDILSGGVMGGIGGYGGAELGAAFNPGASSGIAAATGTTNAAVNQAAMSNMTGSALGQGGFNTAAGRGLMGVATPGMAGAAGASANTGLQNVTAQNTGQGFSPYATPDTLGQSATQFSTDAAYNAANPNLGMFSNAQAVNLGNPVTNLGSVQTPDYVNSALTSDPSKQMLQRGVNTSVRNVDGSFAQIAQRPDFSPIAGSNVAEGAIPGGYVDTSFSAGVERLGGGKYNADGTLNENAMMKGSMKLGLAGLPVLAAAYEPETFTYDQMREAEAYDPDETLNLLDPELDSGIEDVINEDSGLRLYANQGGMVPAYAEGGTVETRADQGMRDALARNKGIAYTRPTTAPSTPTTAPSNNIKIAGAGNSTTNLTGGVGALNVGSGSIGQSPDAKAAQAIEDAKPKTRMMTGAWGTQMTVPIDYDPGTKSVFGGRKPSHYQLQDGTYVKGTPVSNINMMGDPYRTNAYGYINKFAEGGTIESRADQGMRDALARNKGTAYTQPTTAYTPTTAPSNNIKIAGADNSTSNIGGGVGALNVGSGSIGQSANAIKAAQVAAEAEEARITKIKNTPRQYRLVSSGIMGGMKYVPVSHTGMGSYNDPYGMTQRAGAAEAKARGGYAEGGTIESRAKEGMAGALARNKGTAYTRPTTAPVTTTAPSNNIKIAGANNSTSNIGGGSTSNLTGGVGALNVGSGSIGQSPNAIKAAQVAAADRKANFKIMPNGQEVPIDFDPGGFQGVMGGMQNAPQSHYRDSSGNWHKGQRPGTFQIGGNNGSSIGAFLSAPNYYAEGGAVEGYAQGGMLEGPGDGMSDSLAAQIDGSQPAALSQGEFVVPADVVSHLGNGSSDAGSKRLYAMMDEVRQARTGTEKQGKEINPERYMPA